MDNPELFNISGKILDAAGMNGRGRRNSFKRQNPEAYEVYGKTYELTDDKKLKANFLSENKSVVAAMVIATQKLVDDHKSFSMNTSTDMGKKIAVDLDLKKNYEEAYKDIKSGHIDLSDPESFCSLQTNQLLEEAKQESANKNAKAGIKDNSHVVVQTCDKELKCELNSFTIEDAPKSSTADDVLDKLINYFDFSDRSGDLKKDLSKKPEANTGSRFPVDIFSSKLELEEIHLIAGKQNFWEKTVQLTAGGSCGHGKDATCPSVLIDCDSNPVGKFKSNDVTAENTDPKLKNIRLLPHKDSSIKNPANWSGIKNLIMDHQGAKTADYHFSVKHCQGSKYAGYNAVIKVHRPTVMQVAISIASPLWSETGKRKSPFKIGVQFYSRMDEEEAKLKIDPKSATEIISDLASSKWLDRILKSSQRVLNGFDRLDQGQSDNDDIDTVEGFETKTENVPTESGMQSPELHIAYRRLLQVLPDYSGVAYTEEIYIAASPLFQYKRSINVITVLWKSSLAAITGGASILANQALEALGVKELAADCFNNSYEFFRQVIKSIKSYAIGEDISDEEVTEALEEDKESTAGSVKCMVHLSAAAETDNPGAGLVWNKQPGEKWKKSNADTSIYAGVNAEVEGVISADLRVLKILGFGSTITDNEAGIKLQVLSADNTAPVRFGVKMTDQKPEVLVDQIKQDLSVSGSTSEALTEDAEDDTLVLDEKANGDELEGIDENPDKQSELGVSAAIWFTGVGVYISAYIVVNAETIKTKLVKRARDDDEGEDEESESAATKEISKRMSFQLMKERESKPKWLKVPIDRLLVNKE